MRKATPDYNLMVPWIVADVGPFSAAFADTRYAPTHEGLPARLSWRRSANV